MYIVVIGWIWVVLLMALAEAMSPQGSVLGALITFVLYGMLPLAIVLYVMGTPGRRRARLAAERLAGEAAPTGEALVAEAPDAGSQAPGDAVAAERKEP